MAPKAKTKHKPQGPKTTDQVMDEMGHSKECARRKPAPFTPPFTVNSTRYVLDFENCEKCAEILATIPKPNAIYFKPKKKVKK